MFRPAWRLFYKNSLKRHMTFNETFTRMASSIRCLKLSYKLRMYSLGSVSPFGVQPIVVTSSCSNLIRTNVTSPNHNCSTVSNKESSEIHTCNSSGCMCYSPPLVSLQTKLASSKCKAEWDSLKENDYNKYDEIRTYVDQDVLNQETNSKLTYFNERLDLHTSTLIALPEDYKLVKEVVFDSGHFPQSEFSSLPADKKNHLPVTILSGYLDSVPYYMYLLGEHRHEIFSSNKMPLSEYEQWSMSSAASKNSHKAPEDSGRPKEEQLQVIFDAMSELIPKFFVVSHNYHLYHKDVIFENNIRGVKTQGINLYAQQLALIKILGHLRYSHVKMEILKITKHADDGTIKVRWRVVGVPGLRKLIFFWNYRLWHWKNMMDTKADWIDGFSIFYVGSDGLIYKHICDKMMPDEQHVAPTPAQGGVAVKLAFLMGLIPKATDIAGVDNVLAVTRSDD